MVTIDFVLQWNFHNEMGEVLLKIHTFRHLPGMILIKSCLISLSWKTTCLGTFDIQHKIFCPYIERCVLKGKDLRALRFKNLYAFFLNCSLVLLFLRKWLDALLAPSHYLNQRLPIVDFTEEQIQEIWMKLEKKNFSRECIVVCHTFCSVLNV